MRFCAVFLLANLCAAATLHYWVEPCDTKQSPCKGGDPELAEWAFAAWQAASGGTLTLTKADTRDKAQIRVNWVSPTSGLYGEARPITVDGIRGAEVYVSLPSGVADPLLRDTIVYLTCVHESGHALGLQHTADFADIMYSFQYGGDIDEYFGRYRRLLTVRQDIRRTSGISAADRERLIAIRR